MNTTSCETRAIFLIPACNPGSPLSSIVRELLERGAAFIVVVDDGSNDAHKSCFREVETLPQTKVLKHAVNLGKGAALKTALNFAYCEFPLSPGFVTADADGQHAPEDIMAVAGQFEKSRESLVLGVRSFAGEVPVRSRAGNRLTSVVFRWLVGPRLTDTQTGLRGIPRSFVPNLLKIPSSGYEFELDMLIAAKHASIPTSEVPIRTIYLDNNRSSRFNPLVDSMKIYFVLLRFSAVAVVTALLDNTIFVLTYSKTENLLYSQILARIVAMCFNYTAARKAVFLSNAPAAKTLSKYFSIVFLNAALSYALIRSLSLWAGVSIIWAKLIAETMLFLGNFALQREFVFTGEKSRATSAAATDWTSYYQHVPPTARITRRYTNSVLVGVLRRFAPKSKTIVEIGGANSCFVDSILRAVQPDQYRVIDINDHGLELLRSRFPESKRVTTSKLDVLKMPSGGDLADVVFSVGLVEHFSVPDTAAAVRSHFNLVKDSGLVIITFPTPTWLYRAARAVCEFIGVWKFPDERPLRREEVRRALQGKGTVVFEKTLWPLIFTQHLIAVRGKMGGVETSMATDLALSAESQ